MRQFKVVVNGTAYQVEVEEVGVAPVAAPAPVQVAPVAPVAAPVVAAPAAVPAPAAPVAAANGTPIKCPMPGTVLDIKVKVGDSVKKGDILLILEAMKMENEIVAPQDGTVAQVAAQKGQSANSGDLLVVIA